MKGEKINATNGKESSIHKELCWNLYKCRSQEKTWVNKLRTYVDNNNCKHIKMAKNWDEHPIVPNTLSKMFGMLAGQHKTDAVFWLLTGSWCAKAAFTKTAKM
jgi:hypothetical protein